MTEASGFPSWARVGAKVVCVDDLKMSGRPFRKYIARGGIYTIEWVGDSNEQSDDNYTGPAVHLVEVRRAPSRWGHVLPFRLSRFRPLISDSDELGIETIFYRKAGLKSKSPVRESERA